MPVYISFSAEIVPKTTEALIAVLADQANKRVDEVYLMLSTPGGNVINGLNLYNVLRSFPFRLVTHNVGNVDSIGSAVFLAEQQRYACATSMFMFHGVWFEAPSGMRFEEKYLRERLDGILQDQLRIGSIIKAHSNLDESQISELFLEARTKDANFALSVGIIDEIREVNIPQGNPIISLVFQR
jgi:ATP-dependent protease ClpP protease subunit